MSETLSSKSDSVNARKHYIDVAKGLLILLVVWGHFELICRLCYSLHHPFIDTFNACKTSWEVFFMPAFFFITGLCSNFNKPFKKFFIAGFKLLLPGLVICQTQQIIDSLFLDVTPLWIIKTEIKSLLLNGLSAEWFLSSLFLARLGVWLLVRLRQRWLQGVIALVLFVVGLVLYNSFNALTDVWYFKHAAMALIFMLSGVFMKNRVESIYKWWWVYIPLIVVALLVRIDVPYLTNRVDIAYSSIPLFFILSYSGIIFILGISRMIDCSVVLEYLGRNSLVIFLMHFIFYRVYLRLALPLFDCSDSVVALLIPAIYIVNVLSCCGVAYLLNKKWLRWILGK